LQFEIFIILFHGIWIVSCVLDDYLSLRDFFHFNWQSLNEVATFQHFDVARCKEIIGVYLGYVVIVLVTTDINDIMAWSGVLGLLQVMFDY